MGEVRKSKRQGGNNNGYFFQCSIFAFLCRSIHCLFLFCLVCHAFFSQNNSYYKQYFIHFIHHFDIEDFFCTFPDSSYFSYIHTFIYIYVYMYFRYKVWVIGITKKNLMERTEKKWNKIVKETMEIKRKENENISRGKRAEQSIKKRRVLHSFYWVDTRKWTNEYLRCYVCEIAMTAFRRREKYRDTKKGLQNIE